MTGFKFHVQFSPSPRFGWTDVTCGRFDEKAQAEEYAAWMRTVKSTGALRVKKVKFEERRRTF